MSYHPQQGEDATLLFRTLFERVPKQKEFPEGLVDYSLAHWSFPQELMNERKLLPHRPQGKWLPDTEEVYVIGATDYHREPDRWLELATDLTVMLVELGKYLYQTPELIDAATGVVRWPKSVRLGWTANAEQATIHLSTAHFQYHHNPYQPRIT